MDFTVYPGTRIARLPALLRGPALLVRNLVPEHLYRYRYTYRSDDLGTTHFSPFIEDEAFARAYSRVAHHWYGGLRDKRWRTWVLARLARERAGFPDAEPANVAEFGVYRGGCAFIVLSTAGLAPAQRYFLFDTFAGIPPDNLTESEIDRGLAGRLADTSAAEVERLLDPWRSQIELRPGDVFETLDRTETGPLCLAHVDLNGSAATVRALDYAYPRLVPGAVVVLDDYGLIDFDEQRRAVNEFFAGRPESVVALPTSQGLVIKR